MREDRGAATHDATNPIGGFPNAQAPRHVGSLTVDADGAVEKPAERIRARKSTAKKATAKKAAPAKRATKKAAAKRA